MRFSWVHYFLISIFHRLCIAPMTPALFVADATARVRAIGGPLLRSGKALFCHFFATLKVSALTGTEKHFATAWGRGFAPTERPVAGAPSQGRCRSPASSLWPPHASLSLGRFAGRSRPLSGLRPCSGLVPRTPSFMVLRRLTEPALRLAAGRGAVPQVRRFLSGKDVPPVL